MENKLLSVKELAMAVSRDISYIYACRANGFTMISGRATLENFLNWLEKNPNPRGKNKLRAKSTKKHEKA